MNLPPRNILLLFLISCSLVTIHHKQVFFLNEELKRASLRLINIYTLNCLFIHFLFISLFFAATVTQFPLLPHLPHRSQLSRSY